MSEDPRLLEKVLLWEEAQEQGEPLGITQLCVDCPDLVPLLRDRLRGLGRINVMLTANLDATVDGSSLSTPEALLVELPGYEILGEAGRGGMSVVYRARDTRLNRIVALKVLLGGPHATPTEQARFKSEVEAIARLQHPHLIQVYEVGKHAGQFYYAMEYVDGANLEEYLGAGSLPPTESAELLLTLAEAMDAAHQRGVIHRDLKPANILVARPTPARTTHSQRRLGTAKISDFGLAKRIDVAAGPTVTGNILGTPSYMAPEQARGHSKQVGPGTDVYALGAMLYRLLTGRPPFVGENAVHILRQVADEEPVPPRHVQPTVPLDLDTICLKCLNKQPGHRYDSAAALADDLRRFLAHQPVMARPIGWYGRAAKWARRRPAVAALVAVSGLAILIFVAASSWFTQRLAAELQNTRAAHNAVVAARDDLQLALARQVADALDADFRQLEMVPQAMAALLAQRARWEEQELEQWTRALVEKDKRIFGIGIAFEPRQFSGLNDDEDYCLYVYEGADGVSSKQLLPPTYPAPFYRQRDWYAKPKATGQPWWSEPYHGQRAEDTPMLTYAVPIFRNGTFVGVVIADLAIEYFRELHRRLQEQYLGPDSYGFVLSSGGEFLYHPDPQYEFPAGSAVPRRPAAPESQLLIEELRARTAGSIHTNDSKRNSPATFYFARIPATGASFVLVHRDPR